MWAKRVTLWIMCTWMSKVMVLIASCTIFCQYVYFAYKYNRWTPEDKYNSYFILLERFLSVRYLILYFYILNLIFFRFRELCLHNEKFDSFYIQIAEQRNRLNKQYYISRWSRNSRCKIYRYLLFIDSNQPTVVSEPQGCFSFEFIFCVVSDFFYFCECHKQCWFYFPLNLFLFRMNSGLQRKFWRNP